jgi:hypothetical protein
MKVHSNKTAVLLASLLINMNMSNSKVPREYRVAYDILYAAAPCLLLLKGFRDPDFLEEHGTCEEIAARTVEIKTQTNR